MSIKFVELKNKINYTEIRLIKNSFDSNEFQMNYSFLKINLILFGDRRSEFIRKHFPFSESNKKRKNNPHFSLRTTKRCNYLWLTPFHVLHEHRNH